MVRVVYPGSFDPVTLGHLDIIKRASAAFDEVIIGVLNNSEKKSPLFTLEERVIMLKEVTSDLPNVIVECVGGLLVDFVKAKGSNIIVRGVRAMADFNIELQMAQTNRAVANDIDTVFFSTSTQYSAISSSVVKEYASYGVSVKDFVPAKVLPKIEEKYKKL